MKKKLTGKSAVTGDKLIGTDPLAFMAEEEMPAALSGHEESTVLSESAPEVEVAVPGTVETDGQEQNNKQDLSDACVIDLGVSLNIREAEALYKQLGESSADQFVLNASEIEKVDTTGLQLLTVFIRHVEKEGKSVEWFSPDENLRHAAGLLGLSKELRLP